MISVVDLFAGPGGLGEGFSAYNAPENNFKICVSIENDEVAHKTLLLRSFFRQFNHDHVPDKYYEFVRKPKYRIDELNTLLDGFNEGNAARKEALCLELGKNNETIFEKIEESIRDQITHNLPWVLIGGPPCQAYSLVGRARNKNKLVDEYNNRKWSLDTDPRSTLYREYLSVLARFQPAVFIMENVKGMLSAKLGNKRVIDLIMNDLRRPNQIPTFRITPLSGKNYSYKLFSLVRKFNEESSIEPADFVIKCEDYGIPQKRHRVIILGIRSDIDSKGNFDVLTAQDEYIPVKKAIYDLPAVYSNFSSRKKKLSRFDGKLLKYPDWKEMVYDFFSQNDTGDPKTEETIKVYLNKLKNNSGRKPEFFNPTWFYNERLEGHVCNHEPRTHIRSDFLRYFYVCCYGKANKTSPRLKDFPDVLLPSHKNIDTDTFVDRFKVQLEDQPSKTVTCHISKDGHYYIHPDPRQCRSLTVREAARLQTFPDDYFFCGNRTQQYHQVGNAVPPLLARQIAGIVYQIIEQSGQI
ncbi:MAG: DNA cytosine methyltransferase [Candidatus Peribacteraceae bacterium]|nr:DNA cytosine methyltransferase [Candidatus Peribacteraceae bacterium]